MHFLVAMKSLVSHAGTIAVLIHACWSCCFPIFCCIMIVASLHRHLCIFCLMNLSFAHILVFITVNSNWKIMDNLWCEMWRRYYNKLWNILALLLSSDKVFATLASLSRWYHGSWVSWFLSIAVCYLCIIIVRKFFWDRLIFYVLFLGFWKRLILVLRNGNKKLGSDKLVWTL